MYEFLERDLAGADNKMLWKVRLPLKIQIFMCQVFRNAIPTRDNVRKRHWLGNPTCSFRNQVETVNHLFFSSSIAKVAWGVLAFWVGLLEHLLDRGTYGNLLCGFMLSYLEGFFFTWLGWLLCAGRFG